MEIFSNLPVVILVVALIAFLAYTGMRLGLPFLVRRVAGLIFVLFGRQRRDVLPRLLRADKRGGWYPWR